MIGGGLHDGGLAKPLLHLGSQLAPLLGGWSGWILAIQIRVISVKFYWFGFGSIKYQIFTDFLQIGRTLVNNFVRFFYISILIILKPNLSN